MLDAIDSFISRLSLLNPHDSGMVVLIILLIWLAVLGCVIWSILSQRFSLTVKLVLVLIVIILPGIGVLVYLPFSLRQDLFPLLGIWRDPS